MARFWRLTHLRTLMKPAFAVLLNGVEPVTLDALRKAFQHVPGMTALDADAHCRDACGILVRNFTDRQAAALQEGLKSAGIESELVEQGRLPILPAGRVIRRWESMPDQLTMADSLGRQFQLPWSDLALLAAGAVRAANFPRTRREWEEVRTEVIHVGHLIAIPIRVRETKFEYSSCETSEWLLRAELVTAGRAARYIIEAENFAFGFPGSTAGHNLADNFCRLVRELADHSPGAALNGGAAAIVGGGGPGSYLRKNSMEDEMTWMLWWAETHKDQGGTTTPE